ncbi:hypothetical protein GMD78_06335 [Ornithinibacillus sp. L9]|uniref:Uncharacterized protein n=1 Tax=Ornithinibacillus caprae TaxID=2678566 RepID=A0A6N8FH46_9BACI|nr:hypothetical protein [Ornithinibacillus caprae]MUK88016.1 hypothetical protein [Ornithinibacillus caprae]
MITIRDSKSKQEVYELRIKELETKIDMLEQSIQTKMDANDVIVKIDELIREKELVTKVELENFHKKMEVALHASQVKIIKWLCATGLSTITAIAAIIRLFIN